MSARLCTRTRLVIRVQSDTEQVYMSCNHPLKAFWTGAYTDSGKKDYLIVPGTFGDLLNVGYAQKKGRRVTPSAHIQEINGQTYLSEPLAIPCGHCSGCRMDVANEWRNRLVLEAMEHPGNCWFVTLTYDETHLPVNCCGEPYLNKSDFQAFMKRLRKNTGRKFRYLAVGEYGDCNKRPHFHMILFGEISGFERTGINRFQVQDINDAWWYGLTEVSIAEPGTMAYVAGYVNKKQKDVNWDDYPVKPFRLMSRKPAIGDYYRVKHDFEKECFHIYGAFGGKNSAPLPRIFVIKSENEAWFEDYKKRMETAAKEAVDSCRARYGLRSEEDIGFLRDLFIDIKNSKKGGSL